MSFITEFTTDIRHIKGKFNVVADALSRVNTLQNDTIIDFHCLQQDQNSSPEIENFRKSKNGLKLEMIPFDGVEILCDTSTRSPRPILPTSWTKRIFQSIHDLSHPGPRPTQQAIGSRFVWPGMKKDIREWCKTCHACQASKINRHTQSPLVQPLPPTERFKSLHVDLVGPLPSSEGMTYLFTVIDRFTRWPEAIPIPDATATTCAKALLRNWISRFGVPDEITSDQGPQFTSTLWKNLNTFLGTKVNKTTAYHPQANGMIERFHRQLKNALKARTTSTHWMNELPVVLLGLRTTWRVDPGCTPAELVYGAPLTLPSEFVSRTSPQHINEPTNTFLHDLRKTIREVEPPPPLHHQKPRSFVPSSLSKSSHVYVRRDSHRTPLQRPYDGPFPIIRKEQKYYEINVNGLPKKISIDRLKPAFLPNVVTEGG
jgi:hypothetical protein